MSKSKKILIVLSTVIILFTFTVPTFALEFSAAPSESDSFVSSPGILIHTSVSDMYGNHYYISYDIDPLFPADDPDPSLYISESSGTLSYDFQPIGSYNITYDNFSDHDSGSSFGCDYLLNSFLGNSSFFVGEGTSILRLSLSDFYIWEDDPRFSIDQEIGFSFHYSFDGFYTEDPYYPSLVNISYSYLGDSEIHTVSLNASYIYTVFPNGSFQLKPNKFLPEDEYDDDTIIYIHSLDIFYPEMTGAPSNFQAYGYIGYCARDDLRDLDVNAHVPNFDNPSIPLISYSKWLGTAASGFLDLEIFPGFTLSGMLMTLISFSCCIWFLKLIAGG